MKKIISLALTLCMVISLFVAAIPVHAEVTLPDETITVVKEVTKTVSIADFKALALYSSVDGYLTSFDDSFFIDSDEFSGGKAFVRPAELTSGNFTADFWYPLTDAQTLKEVSFKVNNKVESYIYFGANNANGLYVGRYG
ncbi:MAG: hypothetical protein IJP22_02070, partial [Clostridia bacterium]|nr:hypothetical protein [Clostridia bacterium]